jgi:cystine transport system substrate-binding protein
MKWVAMVLALISAPVFADTYAVIKSRGVLTIGLEGTYPPFGYQDENGTLVGFDVDICRSVAERMGLKPQFQPAKFEGILAALEIGRFDVVCNQITMSEARSKAYDFSEPYTYSGLQLIVRKDRLKDIKGPNDLAGKKVGVLLGTNHEKWLQDNTPKAEIRTYEDDATRNQDLLVGRIDAVLNDRLIVGSVLKTYGGNLQPVGEPISHEREAIAVKKGNPELVAALNQAIASLVADGSFKRISEKWFGQDVTHP